MKDFDEMLAIMHRLRNECPWDKEQNLLSLRAYLLEESYECLEAMNEFIKDESKAPLLIEELGDVLLQVFFQSEILSESLKRPIMKEVLTTLRDKLVRRHPHIFEESKNLSAKAVHAQWDEIKAKEKPKSRVSLLDGLSKGLSSLQTAQKLGERSSKIQFDWTKPEEVYNHLESELEELKNAKSSKDIEDELGDVLFCLVQWARHKGIDAEVALAGGNLKFQRRFRKMEALSALSLDEFKALTVEDKEKLWEKAKQVEKTKTS